MAIEYGAQAMAVHGSLLSANDESTEQLSYLVAAHKVEFWVNWLPDIDQPLTIKAECLIGDANGMIYQFTLYALSRLLVQGRLAVMISQ